MTPQTFRAATTQAALDQVQQALGPEALILSVRQVPGGPAWQAWKKPEVEVMALPSGVKNPAALPASFETSVSRIETETAAVLPVEVPAPAPKTGGLRALYQTSAGESESSNADVRRLLERLSSEMERVKQKGQPAAEPASTQASASTAAAVTTPEAKTTPTTTREVKLPHALQTVKDELLEQGLQPALIERMLATCRENLSPRGLEAPARIRNYIRQQLEVFIHDLPRDPIFKPGYAHGQVVCLVGSSGAGKTSTLAKLAGYATQKNSQQVVWICADTVRTGAIQLARAYADPLGIPLHVVYTPAELAEAVSANRQADIILVDTPACNARREADLMELSALLSAVPQRAAYLVAPATTKSRDLLTAAGAYSALGINGLVFTHLDETTVFGDLYNLAWQSQLPVAYLSDGQRVLENLHPGNARRLIGLLFGENLN